GVDDRSHRQRRAGPRPVARRDDGRPQRETGRGPPAGPPPGAGGGHAAGAGPVGNGSPGRRAMTLPDLRVVVAHASTVAAADRELLAAALRARPADGSLLIETC